MRIILSLDGLRVDQCLKQTYKTSKHLCFWTFDSKLYSY